MFREAQVQWDVVRDRLANQGVTWYFISPSAPHFGGLWEAAVKSAKTHLRRVIGQQILTYEEMSTLLSQIEFYMNLPPLTNPSGDSDDLEVLTPRHLITGFAPRLMPEPLPSLPELNQLTHWRLVQAMRDHFWSGWSHDYLHTFQQRGKWKTPQEKFRINDLALIIDPSLLRQGRWPFGRIIEIHTDHDGLVRVVTLRTSTGTYTRPVTKLCRFLDREP